MRTAEQGAATPKIELPEHLQRLFERMPLVSIGDNADLSKESVNRFLKVLDEDVEKFANFAEP